MARPTYPATTVPLAIGDLLARQNKSTIKLYLDPEGDDGKVAFNGNEDYNDQSLTLAKAFAVETIKDGKSKYQISDDTTASTGPALQSDSGLPSVISDEAPGGAEGKTFLSSNSNAKSYFIRISDPGIYTSNGGTYNKANNRTEESVTVIKGKAVAGPQDLDFIKSLEEINEVGSDTVLVRKIGNTLAGSNTFYPQVSNENEENVYSQIGTLEEQSNVGRTKIQNTLGSYSRTNKIGDNDNTNDGNTILIQKDFLNLGNQITLRGAGEYYIPKFGENQTNDDPALQILAARAAALAPGLGRLGIRVPFNQMTPYEVLNNNFNGVLKQDKKINVTSTFPDLSSGEEINSYGSYNSWIAPFDGFERILQMPAITIMLIAEALVFSAIAEIIQGITQKDQYADRFRAGFLAFFGLQGGDGAYTDFGRFTLAVLGSITSPTLFNATGWFATATRSIIKIIFSELSRGIFAFAGAIGGGAPGSTGVFNRTGIDIYSDGLQGDIIGAAARLIELFLNSRLISMTDMFVNIGTTIVNPLGESLVPYKQGAGRNPFKALTPNQPSYIDNVKDAKVGSASPIPFLESLGFSTAPNNEREKPLTPALIKKDRLIRNYGLGQVGKRPIAWGTSTTPSTFLLPQNIQFAGRIAGDWLGVARLADLKNIGAVSTLGNRLPKEEVDNIEKELEASYMPFYIQDLRTNEVISFHAFIQTMQDSFSANYNSQTAIGRIEPIHIYKDSNRDMTISFTIVATNADDHDAMWWKINKLVTLVYPQFTKGRQLSSTETVDGTQVTRTFTQPFSQLAGASPMVRIRVGDVWKNNYSRFNVMRLFGIGNGSETNLVGNTLTTGSINESIALNTTSYNEVETLMYRNMIRLKEARFQAGDRITIDYNPAIDNRVFGINRNDRFVAAEGNLWGASKELRTPSEQELPSGKYTFQIVSGEPTIGLATGERLVYTYSIRKVENDAVDDTKTFIFRYPNPDALLETRRSGNSFDEIGNNFTAFGENETRQQIDVANAAYNLSINIDYEWLRTGQFGARSRATNPDDNITRLKTSVQNFFSPSDGAGGVTANPIMQAFETVSGKGIAGFIGSLGIDWNESRWETEWNPSRYSSRAPMMVKIDIKFLPVHDITPGLDSNGFMRAPVYSVGRYSNGLNEIETGDIQNAKQRVSDVSGWIDITRNTRNSDGE